MRTQPKDLYAILGLGPDATEAELRRQYRALLRRFHPDTRVGALDSSVAAADAALHEVLAAYEVLGDPARRADYDRMIAALRGPAVPSPSPSPVSPVSSVRVPVPVPVRRRRATAGDAVPIRAGPVRWHPS